LDYPFCGVPNYSHLKYLSNGKMIAVVNVLSYTNIHCCILQMVTIIARCSDILGSAKPFVWLYMWFFLSLHVAVGFLE